MTTDQELLREFAQTRSEETFAEMVRRYVNLVYSTALRRTGGDAYLAQDVAQIVFADLARKASSLCRRESLSGWLYTSAHFASAKVVRTEVRRREREERFMREPANESAPEADWAQLRPVLDEAMHELKDADREAILLRYFENRPFTEVGARLGLNENTARMRVERALDKLRGLLCKRGIETTASLASLVSAHAVQVAPAHLAATLTAASMTAAAQTGVTLTILKLMTATQIKVGIGALAVAGAATVMVVQHQTQANLRLENEALRQQIAQVKTEPDSQPVAGIESNTLPTEQLSELLRLRGEVGVLRRQTNELRASLASAQRAQRPVTAIGQPQPASADDYPKTADGATKGIFEAMGRGDWDTFFANFGEPGVPREIYERAFTPQVKSNLAGLEIVSLGQPTNSFGPNMFFVPYKIRFKDGSEKEFQLHVAQDPRTQRWYLKGGL